MKNYPKIGIRPAIDGRQGGVRESLEEKTMNLAKAVASLITENLRNGDGSPVGKLYELDGFDHGSVIGPACILIRNDIRQDGKVSE